MKSTLIALLLLVSAHSFAKDMSRMEKNEDVYQEGQDGTEVYIGRCSVHQDYENKMFRVTKTLVKYFEPKRGMTDVQFALKVKNVEAALLFEATKLTAINSLKDADDLTVEQIENKKFMSLDLYRLNIGVGGGNGLFAIYNRTLKNGHPHYELMAHIFDGDIEFCDTKVWLKK